MKLLIAVPAYNEEAAIAATVERCLHAREEIVGGTPVSQVDITVVSDGSTDGTVAALTPFRDRIDLVVFPHNRGYGAAIKEAWRRSDADLVGFLDADGTCDPHAFAPLVRELLAQGADLAIGCRMHQGSEMPLIRRVGNRLFAAGLGLLSGQRVRDTASGMRVLRRDAAESLAPLPDGLHFTPAMSARALLGRRVRVTEVDVPYHERTGASKLRVISDGLRFLQVILEAAFLYRPSRPLAIAGVACLAAATLLMVTPIVHYLRTRTVAEWMIYRFLVAHLAGVLGALLLSGAYLGARIVQLVLGRSAPVGWTVALVGRLQRWPVFWTVECLLTGLGAALVWPSVVQLVETGATYEHWSRFVAMSFFLSVASVIAVTRILDYSLDLLAARQQSQRSEGLEPADPPTAGEDRSAP